MTEEIVRVPDEGRRAKPLFWRRGTDHPQDYGCDWVANGIGGRYHAEKQRDGSYLLWWPHDEFTFVECSNLAETKARAEEDWQEKYAERAALAALTSEKQPKDSQPIDEVIPTRLLNPER